MRKVLAITAAALLFLVVVFGLTFFLINRDSDGSALENAAVSAATPWPDGSCRYETIEQAQQDMAFTIIYPQPIPDGFELEGVSASPYFETQADCASAKTITIFYPLVDPAGGRVTNAVQIRQGTIMNHQIDPDSSDTIELDGVYVSKSTNVNEAGTHQSYSWNTDEVGITVVASLDERIAEADLMAFVIAMAQE